MGDLAAGWERPSVEDYIDGQFTGKKAALRPVFDAVRTAALALGDDVTIEGRGTIVPFVRRRQFAVTATTHITVTLTSDPGGACVQWVERLPGSGFRVHLTKAVRTATTFSYFMAYPFVG